MLITAPMHSIELQFNQAEQKNCYECYKVILNPELHHDEKYFCSEACMEKFMAQLRVVMWLNVENLPILRENLHKNGGVSGGRVVVLQCWMLSEPGVDLGDVFDVAPGPEVIF